MAKFCAFDGKELMEEQGTEETRGFFKYGKLCLYFCNDNCMVDFYSINKGKKIRVLRKMLNDTIEAGVFSIVDDRQDGIAA